MKRREMAILALAAVGALYAAWSLFLAPQPGNGGGEKVLDRAALEKTASEVRDLLGKSQPNALENYILARATSALPRDPFHRTTTPNDSPVTGEKKQAAFTYNGFLEMGDERFAIVNGMEYRVGDELDEAGYYLASIERNKVIIERRFPGQASSTRIVVPMTEADIAFAKKESEGNGTAAR